VRLKPDWPEARNNLATAFYRKGSIEQAIEHWAEAVDLEPDWAEACNNLAWVLATIEDEKLLNPAEAVRLAERACELTDYKQPGMLDTLGVAYAAAGRFSEAVKTAEKGIELARDAKDEKTAEDIRSRLELYKMNKPYRD
jgi:tetratricopeptide (TPR) repeat protein